MPGTAPVASGYMSDSVNRTAAQMETACETLVSMDKEQLGGSAEVSKTLATDTFTISTDACIYSVLGEGGASDNLATISVGSINTGKVIGVRNQNSAQVITVKHGSGNINLQNQADRVLADTRSWIFFMWTGSVWAEIFCGTWSLLNQMPGVNDESAVTLASHAFQPTNWCNAMTCQTGTPGSATDNINNMTIGNNTPSLVIIHIATAGDTITVNNNAGGTNKLFTYDGNDVALTSVYQYIMFRKNSTTWKEVGRFGFSTSGTSYNQLSKTGSFSMNDSTMTLYKVDTSGGVATGTLATSPADGRVYKVWVTSATNNLTINTTGAQPIYFPDGTNATSLTVANGQGIVELVAVTGGYLLT